MANVFYKLQVIEKQILTRDTILLKFHIPSAIKEKFQFSAGQYLTLQADINEERIRRSYSLCTSPTEDSLAVAVKAIDGGIFSNYIKDVFEEGDYLEVGPPEGRFTYETSHDSTEDIFLLAAGSGITPIISILKNILYNERTTTVTLLFANRTLEDTLFSIELKALKAEFSQRFTMISIFSREYREGYHSGHINHDFLTKLFHEKPSVHQISKFYSCGPESLILTFERFLESLGVSREKMKNELFYSVEDKDHSDYSNFHSIETEVEVIINGKSFQHTIDSSRNVLESLLELGLDVPYSCKKGNCCSCVGKVLSGSVLMKETEILMKSEIADGFILTCQCIPSSEIIRISYDEY